MLDNREEEIMASCSFEPGRQALVPGMLLHVDEEFSTQYGCVHWRDGGYFEGGWVGGGGGGGPGCLACQRFQRRWMV